MKIIILGLVFAASGILFWVLLLGVYWPQLKVKYRLLKTTAGYNTKRAIEDERTLPFRIRIILPVFKRLKKRMKQITPKGMREVEEEKIQAAGYPFGLKVTGWIVLKNIFSILLPCLFILYLSLFFIPLSSKILLFASFSLLSHLMPRVYLKQKAKDRQLKIQRQLPDALDLLVVSVEAGLSFDGALVKVGEKGKGALETEFNKVLDEIRLGVTRKQALINMTKRCQINDLKIFISSIIQAEQLGASMGNILRIQADQMRTKRRQRAQELAMKTPVKMIFPLVFCVFPSIFIVILGPALIQIMDSFSNM